MPSRYSEDDLQGISFWYKLRWKMEHKKYTPVYMNIYRFLMLTSMFPMNHAAAKTVKRPAVMVNGLRSPSNRV